MTISPLFIFLSIIAISLVLIALASLFGLYKEEVKRSAKFKHDYQQIYKDSKDLENKYRDLETKYYDCLFFKEHGMTEVQYNDMLWDNCVKNNQPIL